MPNPADTIVIFSKTLHSKMATSPPQTTALLNHPDEERTQLSVFGGFIPGALEEEFSPQYKHCQSWTRCCPQWLGGGDLHVDYNCPKRAVCSHILFIRSIKLWENQCLGCSFCNGSTLSTESTLTLSSGQRVLHGSRSTSFSKWLSILGSLPNLNKFPQGPAVHYKNGMEPGTVRVWQPLWAVA